MNHNLESGAQRQVAEWVRDLPEEEPSLVWRSGLNERIRVEAARREKTRRRWTFAFPGLGFATAAALGLILLVPRPAKPAPAPAGHVEANLVALYEDSVRTDDIVGAGVRPWEAPAASVPAASVPDPRLDLEAL